MNDIKNDQSTTQIFDVITGEPINFPYRLTITQAFEFQTSKTPDLTAVVCCDETLSYLELNQKANQLAYYLKFVKNIQPGSLIAISMDRKKSILLSILAILKVGAAYIPIDPSFPDERVQHMLKDTRASLLLADSETYARLSKNLMNNLCEILNWEFFFPKLFSLPQSNLDLSYHSITSSDLAYVIYTSGSSGKPKGVMVEHIGVINLAIACAPLFGVERNNVDESTKQNFLWYSNFVFDAHVWEIFTPLLNGHTLHIIENELRLNTSLLQLYIKENSISIALLPPALLDTRTIFELKTLILGGEKTTLEQLAPYKDTKVNIINAYGLTETTVISTLNQHFNGNTINNIGKPIYNTHAYVLDKNLNHVKSGEIGELYLSGIGLSRGYLNDAELTQKVYLPNPFQKEADKLDQRFCPLGRHAKLFKTGDLAQILQDGSIAFKGRSDFQIKLRGYRIETEEIESVLNSHPDISKSLVTLKEPLGLQSPLKYLIAYYTAQNQTVDEKEIVKYLSSRLPEYMIPHQLIQLPSFPINLSGKIDLFSLPDPPITKAIDFLEARDEFEKRVRKNWAETFKMDERFIGIKDDFFGLGGNSILAIQLAFNLSKELKTFINTKMIFTHRTIESFANEYRHSKQETLAVNKHTFNKLQDQCLSYGQEGLYFIHQFEGGSVAYNISLIYKINCMPFNLEAFKSSLKKIVQRHEILRTRIAEDENGNLYQFTSDELELSKIVNEISLSNKAEMDNSLKAEISHKFDFNQENPLRTTIWKLPDGETYVSFVVHHLAFDGWSADLFLNELRNLYRHYDEGEELCLPDASIQYKDFAVWQRSCLKNGTFDEQWRYWKTALEDYAILRLIPDKSRSKQFCYKGQEIHLTVDLDITASLRVLARQLNVSLYSVLLSAFCLMLRVYTYQDDVIIGTPVANRNYKGTEHLIGYFVNTLPFRTIINSNTRILDYILHVSQKTIDLQLHQDIPFEKIVSELNLPKDPSRHPLFQVVFGVQSFASEKLCPWLKKCGAEGVADTYAKFDLSVFLDDEGNEIKGLFNFASDLYTASTVQGYLNTYLIILKQFTEIAFDSKKKESCRISDLRYLDQKEYEKIIYQWNSTAVDFKKNISVSELFEEQVQSNPMAIALVEGDKIWNYRELNDEVKRLANYLSEVEGLGPRKFVVLCMDRSALLIISILAVLKLGSAYVPVDPGYPEQRILHILEETEVSLVITDNSIKINHLLSNHKYKILDVNKKREFIAKYSLESRLPVTKVMPSDIAYVIYTSGTTGKPKGVVIEHRSVVNYIFNIHSHGIISASDIVDFSTQIGFDLSVTNSICSICIGAKVCIYQGNSLDLSSYKEHLKIHKITFIKHVPSYFDLLLDFLPSTKIRHVVLGGEKLKISTIKNLHRCYKESKTEDRITVPIVYDEYGPTEATVGSTLWKINPEENFNIGVPYNNVQVYVLNDNFSPVPVGALGQLYIGGRGLARGYLKDPDLTAKRFISHPLQSEEFPAQSERIYQTGDIVRWLENGHLEYFGRLDAQAKINGFRIEPAEIEQILNTYDGILQSTVYIKNASTKIETLETNNSFENRFLIGYYKTVDQKKRDESSLKLHMAKYLPSYMIPKFFVHMHRFPLTKNGKIDFLALPEPSVLNFDTFQPPSQKLEILFHQIWSDILSIPADQIGINQNFFDLGGNSILLLKVKSRIEQALGNKLLNIIDLFKYPTIGSLSSFLLPQIDDHQKKCFSVSESKRNYTNEIAVIAMSGAFSNSKDIQQFWSNLLKGQDCISRLSKEKCNEYKVPKEKVEHENYLAAGGLIENADKFDPEFWGMSINDASLMDPQIRIFLEHSYHTLELGGYIRKRDRYKIGVFAGMNQSQYYNLNKNNPLLMDLSDWEKRSLSDPFQIATRTSYLLGLTGISLTINTACSTSLVSIIEACKNLSLGVCDMALAGGVALTIPEDFGDIAQEGMIFSPDGICKVFDAHANGTIRGSGVGVVLLKPLLEAQKDKDPVLAVIKGYDINNDGKRKIGYTAPSPLGQTECISNAIQKAGISPESIGYFECHGTGTSLGDAIEITALKEVFANSQHIVNFSSYLGSVKANIGHADTASGVASFIKACKMLEAKIFPPQINYQLPNQLIDIANGQFKILSQKQPWERNKEFPRRIGVSSFGIGGTNAHLILEEYESTTEVVFREEKDQLCLIPISAKSTNSYREFCLALNQFIESYPEFSLSDIAFVLQHLRDEFPIRNIFTCSSKLQLQKYLLAETPPFEVQISNAPPISFSEMVKDISLDDLALTYEKIGKLWCSGFKVNWGEMANTESIKKACYLLPGYPFQKIRCWLESNDSIVSSKHHTDHLNQKPEKNANMLVDAYKIEKEIMEAFSEVLGCSSIDKHSNFFDLGGNSISALRLAKRLSRVFGLKVSAATILRYDSIEKLTNYWSSNSTKKSSDSFSISQGEI